MHDNVFNEFIWFVTDRIIKFLYNPFGFFAFVVMALYYFIYPSESLLDIVLHVIIEVVLRLTNAMLVYRAVMGYFYDNKE